MADTCKDINGNEINNFYFADDGVVYGVLNSDGSTSYEGVTVSYDGEGELVNLGSECCTSMNFNFDSNSSQCFYREVIATDSEFKIVFNAQENNGVVFTKSEVEECSLNLKFDYLIEYNSNVIYQKYVGTNVQVMDLLRGLNLSVAIEKYGFRETSGEMFETTKTLIPILSQDIYSGVDVNQATGIILSGDKTNLVNNKLMNELGPLYNDQITNSDWLQLDLIINDPELIDQIINEEVKFSIQVNKNACDFSIILDNIQLNKVCDIEFTERRTLDKSPSFNLKRVVDNKKSWINTEKNRVYDLPIRETKYEVDDERLIINSKEMELSTSVADAIEIDVVSFSVSNNTLLLGVNGSEPHMSIDLTSIITTDYSSTSVEDLNDILRTELIDVKTRKSSIGYPTLEMVYDRYLNSDLYDGLESNKYTFGTVSNFINLLGNHWVDLIEQVIPSTTLWGSTDKIKNTIFRENKFKYNRYNLMFCNRDNEPTLAEYNEVEVILKTVDEVDEFSDKCNNVYIQTLSHDCGTIGTVTIVGVNGTNLTEG